MELRTESDVPLILASASVLIVEKDRLLLEKYGVEETWRLPCKSMTSGETMEQVAQRTISEQTGHEDNELQLLDIVTTASDGDAEAAVARVEDVYHVTAAYLCKDAELLADGSWCGIADELHFFPIEQLPEDLHPQDKHIIGKYLNSCDKGMGCPNRTSDSKASRLERK